MSTADIQQPSSRKDAADKVSKEWLKIYLTHVYGVKFTDQESLRKDLAKSGQQIAASLIADEFTVRLLARFNDLDVSPMDGHISLAEIEQAIQVPKLHFDGKDRIMLQLLKRFQQVNVTAGNDKEPNHDRISRNDLEILSHSLGEACSMLRKRIEDEYLVSEKA